MANYIIIGGDGKQYGPVTETDIRQWISEGRLNAQSLVKADGDAEFRALAQFPEFAGDLRPVPIAPVINTPAGPGDWQRQVLDTPTQLRFGECLAAGGGFLGANAGFVLSAVLLAFIPITLLSWVGMELPIIGPIIALCLVPAIRGGLFGASLRRLRGEAVGPEAVFESMSRRLGPLILTGVVSSLLAEFSVCLLILPCIYLSIAWFFAIPLAADRELNFWNSMELSRKVVTRVWFEVLALLFLAFLPVVLFQVYELHDVFVFLSGFYDQAGGDWQQFSQLIQSHNAELQAISLRSLLIGAGVGALNMLFALGVIIRAYENLFGRRQA